MHICSVNLLLRDYYIMNDSLKCNVFVIITNFSTGLAKGKLTNYYNLYFSCYCTSNAVFISWHTMRKQIEICFVC